jgi:hypothetical protein
VASFTINQFEQDDVKLWGFIAVGAVTIAVVLSSLTAVLPDRILNSLRETRQNYGTISQLQAELTAIRMEFATIKREAAISGTRMTLAEESSSKFSRRVRALESSIPMMLEALPADANIDRSLITASINEANGEEIIQSDGSVKISRSDLFAPQSADAETGAKFEQALPEKVDDLPETQTEVEAAPVIQLSSTEFGIKIGSPVAPDNALLAWQQLKTEVGTLLIGLDPYALPADNDSTKTQLIAGPMRDMAEAISICAQIVRTGIACEASGFGGDKLVQ